VIDPFGSRERLRSEAAAWVVRLDGGASHDDRRAFEGWLAEDPAHQAAYDQVASTYRQSALIRHSSVSRDRDLGTHFPSRPGPMAGRALAASLGALLLLGGYQLATGGLPFMGPPLQAVMLTSGAVAEDVKLEDGTAVRLEPASAIRIDLTRTQRRAQLRRGRARLAVVHDSRPFLLEAGTARSEVREGEFELSVVASQGEIRELKPGQSVSAGGGPGLAATQAQPLVPAHEDVLEFKATPLAEVALRANQTSAQSFLDIDPRLGALRVTGVFKSGDTVALARSLAVVFDLELVSSRTGTLRLQPRQK
jgi:transmembrane sensor